MNYKIYTDGATSGNGYEGAQGGWAWLLLDEEEKIIHQNSGHIDNATNNICELQAVINACMTCTNLIKEDDCITIYSDSAYVINGLNDWIYKWQKNNWQTANKHTVKNQNLWKNLLPYVNDNRFTFKKVAGHSNNKTSDAYWNNYVDEMAVKMKFIKGG